MIAGMNSFSIQEEDIRHLIHLVAHTKKPPMSFSNSLVA